MTATEPGPRSGAVDLGDRTKYLGGSDMAAVLGFSPYCGAIELWRSKRGLEPEPEMNEAMRWGMLHEATVAQEFSVRTGKKIRQRRKAFVDREVPIIQGHIDRDIVGEDAILECKTASAWMANQWGEEWPDDIPKQYIVQCQTYLMLTGKSLCYVAVLIGGNDFRVYEVKANAAWHEHIRGAAASFWKNVEDGVEPDPLSDAEAASRWTQSTDRTVTADDRVIDLLAQLEQAKADKRVAESIAKELTIAIQNEMEDAEAVMSPDGKRKLCTWRSSERRTVDTKALRLAYPEIVAKFEKVTEGRTFRLGKASKPKEVQA